MITTISIVLFVSNTKNSTLKWQNEIYIDFDLVIENLKKKIQNLLTLIELAVLIVQKIYRLILKDRINHL